MRISSHMYHKIGELTPMELSILGIFVLVNLGLTRSARAADIQSYVILVIYICQNIARKKIALD